ncbi:uncharacterized protein TNCT_685251 [Trichonephila clavata]|uniref:Uncharacterized protein n=1 Tax=Trichonephila clavata TaxID=2740835 RepID=A0A8X6IFV5_TRICU|nr:uncharacterized protein TNCT_685251 [Trichonephila clavata]
MWLQFFGATRFLTASSGALRHYKRPHEKMQDAPVSRLQMILFGSGAASCYTKSKTQPNPEDRQKINIHRKGFDDNFIGYILQANACVSKSGDPNLCMKYVGCANDLPKPIKDVFNKCKNSVYPDGFGSCSGGNTLLKSEDDKTQFEECFIQKLPQYKSLDSSEDKAQEKFMKCIYKNGNKCLKS